MYRILTASKDTYITNKIINNSFRATDANVGQAGTLDLFKLYAESVTGSDTTPIELSRILIKFLYFKNANIIRKTFDFLDYQEEEEIKWKLIDDEILIDDSLNKKINLGSENNVWVLKNDMIFLKEKNRALNKAVFLRKVP